MKRYRIDLVSRTSIVVEAADEDRAVKMAENYANTSPAFRPIFEMEDGGIEETEDEPELRGEDGL